MKHTIRLLILIAAGVLHLGNLSAIDLQKTTKVKRHNYKLQISKEITNKNWEAAARGITEFRKAKLQRFVTDLNEEFAKAYATPAKTLPYDKALLKTKQGRVQASRAVKKALDAAEFDTALAGINALSRDFHRELYSAFVTAAIAAEKRKAPPPPPVPEPAKEIPPPPPVPVPAEEIPPPPPLPPEVAKEEEIPPAPTVPPPPPPMPEPAEGMPEPAKEIPPTPPLPPAPKPPVPAPPTPPAPPLPPDPALPLLPAQEQRLKEELLIKPELSPPTQPIDKPSPAKIKKAEQEAIEEYKKIQQLVVKANQTKETIQQMFQLLERSTDDTVRKTSLNAIQLAHENSKENVLDAEDDLNTIRLAVISFETDSLKNTFNQAQKAFQLLKEAEQEFLHIKTQAEALKKPSTPLAKPKLEQDKETSLLAAAKEGDISKVKELLQANTDPNVRDLLGRTPLIRAILYEHEPVVETLLQAGAHVNVQSKSGYTPLMMAASIGPDSIIKKLLQAGAHVNAQGKPGYTALIEASKAGHEPVVKTLLQAGADITLKDDDKTALDYAKVKGYTRIVTLLQQPAKVARIKEKTETLISMVDQLKAAYLKRKTPLSNTEHAEARQKIENTQKEGQTILDEIDSLAKEIDTSSISMDDKNLIESISSEDYKITFKTNMQEIANAVGTLSPLKEELAEIEEEAGEKAQKEQDRNVSQIKEKIQQAEDAIGTLNKTVILDVVTNPFGGPPKTKLSNTEYTNARQKEQETQKEVNTILREITAIAKGVKHDLLRNEDDRRLIVDILSGEVKNKTQEEMKLFADALAQLSPIIPEVELE